MQYYKTVADNSQMDENPFKNVRMERPLPHRIFEFTLVWRLSIIADRAELFYQLWQLVYHHFLHHCDKMIRMAKVLDVLNCNPSICIVDWLQIARMVHHIGVIR